MQWNLRRGLHAGGGCLNVFYTFCRQPLFIRVLLTHVEGGSVNRCLQVGKVSRKARCGKIGRRLRPISRIRDYNRCFKNTYIPSPPLAVLHANNKKGAAPVLNAAPVLMISLHKREKSPAVGHPAFKNGPAAMLAILSGLCFPLALICRFFCNFNQCNSGVALS